MRVSKLVIPLVLGLLIPSIAKAASITLDDVALDAIFGQPSFGSVPVDIRILPSQVVVNAALLDIGTSQEMFFQLFALNLSAPPVVNAYFVDSMSDTACGNVVANLVGCALIGGNNFAVESSFAAGPRGSTLVSHELGHTLGLSHVNDSSRLMNPVISFSLIPLLSASEVGTILGSPFVQADLVSGLRFIELSPVLITATAPVPEPATLLLVATGLGAWRLRRRHAAGRQSQ